MLPPLRLVITSAAAAHLRRFGPASARLSATAEACANAAATTGPALCSNRICRRMDLTERNHRVITPSLLFQPLTKSHISPQKFKSVTTCDGLRAFLKFSPLSDSLKSKNLKMGLNPSQPVTQGIFIGLSQQKISRFAVFHV